MRPLRLITQDFLRSMCALCEKRDTPSLLQTGCFMVPGRIGVKNDFGVYSGTIPTTTYLWAEARRINSGSYKLFQVERFTHKTDFVPGKYWKSEGPVKLDSGRAIAGAVTLAQARLVLENWEKSGLDRNLTLARTPERTPLHFSHWGAVRNQLSVAECLDQTANRY